MTTALTFRDWWERGDHAAAPFAGHFVDHTATETAAETMAGAAVGETAGMTAELSAAEAEFAAAEARLRRAEALAAEAEAEALAAEIRLHAAEAEVAGYVAHTVEMPAAVRGAALLVGLLGLPPGILAGLQLARGHAIAGTLLLLGAAGYLVAGALLARRGSILWASIAALVMFVGAIILAPLRVGPPEALLACAALALVVMEILGADHYRQWLAAHREDLRAGHRVAGDPGDLVPVLHMFN